MGVSRRSLQMEFFYASKWPKIKGVTRVITLAYLKGVMTLFTGRGPSNLLVFFLAFSRFSSSVSGSFFFGLTTTVTHWCRWGGCSSGCKGTSRSLLVFIFVGAFCIASSKARWKAWKHHFLLFKPKVCWATARSGKAWRQLFEIGQKAIRFFANSWGPCLLHSARNQHLVEYHGVSLYGLIQSHPNLHASQNW